jgi:hypothetical protein
VYVASRGPLWERYQKLKNEAAALIRALPEWVPLSQHLADSFKAVTIDLETEFANPLILDPARIEDRLKQLQSVMWTAQAFPTTRDGFTHSIEDLRQRVVRNGGDDDLLAMLDELRAEVPDHPSSEAIVSLSVRLDGIAALVNRRHPFAVTEDFRNHLEQTIQVQVDSLRRYGGDPAVITEAEKSLKAIAEDRSAPLSQRCSKLYSLSVEVNSVYRKVVSARENRGLLSSTPV